MIYRKQRHSLGYNSLTVSPSPFRLSSQALQGKVHLWLLAMLVISTRSRSQPGLTPELSCSTLIFVMSPEKPITNTFDYDAGLYRVAQKTGTLLYALTSYALTSSNIDRFATFFTFWIRRAFQIILSLRSHHTSSVSLHYFLKCQCKATIENKTFL